MNRVFVFQQVESVICLWMCRLWDLKLRQTTADDKRFISRNCKIQINRRNKTQAKLAKRWIYLCCASKSQLVVFGIVRDRAICNLHRMLQLAFALNLTNKSLSLSSTRNKTRENARQRIPSREFYFDVQSAPQIILFVLAVAADFFDFWFLFFFLLC